MKKLVSLLVCLGLCLGMLCGCQGDQPKEGALTQPPELTLSTGRAQALLRSGSYGWEYPTKSGQRVAVVADSMHPLDAQLSPVLGDGQATLLWEGPSAPESVSVCCWPEEDLGNVSAESTEVPWEGEGFLLKEGGWIYEISAQWEEELGSGNASYCVYVLSGEEAAAAWDAIPEAPPALTVSCGEVQTEALVTGSIWGVLQEDGTYQAEQSGELFPQAEAIWDQLPRLEGAGQVTLTWEGTEPYMPPSVTAQNAQGESREVSLEGNTFTLLEGEWMYGILAGWQSRSYGYQNGAEYVFLGVN